jgi:hypothetical protein
MNLSLEQQLRQLTPPKTMKQARELAAFGDAAVPYLLPQQAWSAGTTATCVRALALIGSKLALAALEEYAADGRTPVVKELEQAWNTFDREEYARRVLAITYRDRTHLELIHPPDLAACNISASFARCVSCGGSAATLGRSPA